MTTTLDSLGDLPQIYAGIDQAFDQASYEQDLEGFTEILRETHDEFFYRSQGPDGRDWPEWYWRDASISNDHLPLFASGRLRASLTQLGGADHVEQIGPREMTWGTSVEYSILHNEGAQIRLGIGLVGRAGGFLPPGTIINLPKREHVGMNQATAQQLAEQMADAVVANLRE